MVAYMPQEERAQIDAVQRRLAQKYAELPHDHVAAVVRRVCGRFNQSTVRDYVPLLVERRATEELARSTAGREAVTEVPTPAVAGIEIVAVRHTRPEWRSASWAWLSARFATDAVRASLRACVTSRPSTLPGTISPQPASD